MDLKKLLIKLKSEAIIPAIFASFLLSFTLVFFGPATLYYTNILEYNFKFSDICLYLVGLTIIFGILLTFLSFLFKERIHLKIICIIFALGLLFYIQGNILVWDYGLLNGQEITWNNYLITGIIDSLIWISIIALSFIRSDKIYKLIPVASIFLLIIQTGGLFALVHYAPNEPQWKSYSLFYDGSEFEFSGNTNVIIIVLDTFQSDIFQEIINENVDYQNMFAGFTYYRNAVGGYPTTVASIPLILTGKYYNNSIPFDTFVQTSYESSSLPKTMKENGYIVDIYTTSRLVYPKADIESNIKRYSFYYTDLAPLTKLSLFRHFPQFLKEWIYPLLIEQKTNQESNSDQWFYNRLLEQKIRLNKTPNFKFFHFTGAHPPFQLNESIEYEKLPNNRSGYKEQSKASLRIVSNLLEKFKEKGIFNQSMIIVIGDHGMQNNMYEINTTQLNYSTSISITPQNIVSAGIPLVLIKQFNSTSKLRTSDTPVTLADIPKTVSSELDLPNDFQGESILNITEFSDRERKFYNFDSTYHNIWDPYFPSIREYSIQNFSWFSDSWQPTYRVYTPDGVEIRYPPEYEFGTIVKFANDKKTTEYLISGWSIIPGEEFTWSTGKSAIIAFSMDKAKSNLFLYLPMYPFIIENKSEIQRVIIYINKHEIGNLSLTKSQLNEEVFFIPQEFLNEKVQYMTFSLPDAISPTALGMYDDPRELGIAVSTLNITEIISPQILYADGWYAPEDWSGSQTRWMTNSSVIHIYSSENKTLRFNAKLVSYYRPRTLEIISQKSSVTNITVPPGGIDVSIPMTLNNGDNTFNLLINNGCEKSVDIFALENNDTRCFSIAFQNVTLV